MRPVGGGRPGMSSSRRKQLVNTRVLYFIAIVTSFLGSHVFAHWFHRRYLQAIQRLGELEGRIANLEQMTRFRDSQIVNTSDSFVGVGAIPATTNQTYVLVHSNFGCANMTDVPQDGPGCIRFFTYASHAGRDDKFCESLKSAVRMEIDLEVLGWGLKWRGLQQKFQAVLSVLRVVPAECVVVFNDGHDVLYVQSADHILANYRQVAHATNASIIFSAECGCWPQVIRDKGRTCRDEYPRSPTPLRYLNSGSWIAPAGIALRYFSYLMAAIPKDQNEQDFKKINDQELASDAYMNETLRRHFSVALDHYSRLFGVMHPIKDDTLVPNCNPNPWYRFSEGHGFHNTFLNSTPGVLHFNGGGKPLFDKYNAQLRKSIKEPPDGGILKFRNHCRSLHEAVNCKTKG